MARRILLSWSSGKDAAWALHVLRQSPDLEVVGLLTVLNEAFDRVSMHGVRSTLLEAQAEAVGLPLWPVPLPWPCPEEDFRERMEASLRDMRRHAIDAVAYGDLFLEDIRAYRLSRHQGTGIEALFPLWGRATPDLAREMIRQGLRATLTCVDSRRLAPSFAGRDFDSELLEDLPPDVDACGENGEFHTFAWDGPMFSHPVRVVPGEAVEREGFVFKDLLPVSG